MEEERERRRMRDRQRRQSMTLEQRERHLARRRRNYQLRRLRAETQSPCDIFPQEPAGFESTGETATSNERRGLNDDGFDPIGREKINSVFLESACQETLGQKSVGTAKTLRLSRIRCLARSLNYSEGRAGGSLVNLDATSESNADTTWQFGDSDSSRLLGGVRFNRVKRIARGLNTATNVANAEIQQEQDLVREETPIGH